MESKRRASISLIETLVIVGIVIAANIAGYYAFKRLDLTENKQYTVSAATRKVLRELDDPVSVEFFMSDDLPSQMIRIRADVRDMLQEFDIYGGANFRVRYTDPGDDTEEQTRAEGLGVPKFQLQVVKKEGLSVQDVYFGLVLNYRDKSEAIPQVLDPSTMEYELTSRLMRLTMDAKPKIAYFVGSININQQEGPAYNALQQLLGGAQGFYELVQLDPQTDQKLPDGVAAVFVFGAWGLSDNLKYSLDQFLLNGGDVFLCFDPMMQMGQEPMGGLGDAFPSLDTVEPQLEKYGITVSKKLVTDTGSPAQAQFSAGFMRIVQDYPLWPKLGPNGITDKIGALSSLETAVLPWCAPLSDVETPGVEFTPLFYSSEDAFLLSSPFKLDPNQNWEFLATTSEERGPFKLGYQVTGAIPTAFPDGPPPAGPGADGAASASVFDESKHVVAAKPGARLMVVSTAAAFSDNFLQQFPENQLLLMNLADMLALSEDLGSIRSAPVTARPLRPLNDSQKSFIRWAAVATLPLLVVLLGVVVWMLRARRRHAIQRRYAQG